MGVTLAKGGNVSLSKAGAQPDQGRGRSRLGCTQHHRRRLRPRRQRLGHRPEQKVLSDQHFVFYNNLRSPDGSIEHTGDNLTGEGDGDDEVINVDLAAVPPNVTNIFFPVSIHDADARVAVLRSDPQRLHPRRRSAPPASELARYDLSEDASTETAMVFGELYRHSGEWKFRAIGQGYASGLAGIARDYGVNI